MFEPSTNGRPARPGPGLWPLSVYLFLGFLVSITGCGGCSSKTITSPGKTSKSGTPNAGRDLLDPALSMMLPENLGVRAHANQATGLLNQWRDVQMEVAGKDPQGERFSATLSEATRELLEKNLSPEAAIRAERDEFNADDVRHIRTARLARSIVDHVAKGIDGELGRARVVFDYVTRNVQLVAEENALPLTPYEMLIFGQGTAEDRAWVFAELLRQLNQDAVIVKPLSESSETVPWFVGAVVKDEIHLFDPLRSTPVPLTLKSKTQDITPATLADLSQPMVLASLAPGTEAALSPKAFETVRLEIIGSSSLWSPRLQVLQGFLSGEDSAVISQKLTGDAKDSSAVVNRMASLESPQWNRENLRLWSHPETRLEKFAALESLSEQWKPFDVPLQVDSKTGQLMPGVFTKRQLRTRTEQLMGGHQDAISSYQSILYAHNRWASQLTPELLSMYADAAEDAFFWSAVCQMEAGDFADAADKLASYIKNYERFADSRHGGHARIELARCLIEEDRPADALDVLSPFKPASPEYATAAFLMHALESTKSPKAASNPPKGNVPERPQPKTPQEPAIAEKPAA